MPVVVEAFDRAVLNGAVHPLNLAVGSRVIRLGETLLDVVGPTDHVEAHLSIESGISVARRINELDAIVGQNRVDLVRHGFEQVFEEFLGRSPVDCLGELDDGELARAVGGNEQAGLAFGGLHLRDMLVDYSSDGRLEEGRDRLVIAMGRTL